MAYITTPWLICGRGKNRTSDRRAFGPSTLLLSYSPVWDLSIPVFRAGSDPAPSSALHELTELVTIYPKTNCRTFIINEGFAREVDPDTTSSRLEGAATSFELPAHSGLLVPRTIITSRNARGNPLQRLAVFSQGPNATAVSALLRSGS